MTGRVVRVAALALLVALVLPASSRTLPGKHAPGKGSHTRIFLATCPGGPACVDLDVSQGDSPDPVPAGDELTYTVTLQNHGPDAAPAVSLVDTLPAGLIPADTTVSSNVDTPGNPACSVSESGDIFCFFGTVENTDLNGPPNFPGPRVVTIKVTPDPTQPPPAYPRTITNHVAVNSNGFIFDRNTNNNQSDGDTQVTSPGDLKITKTHPPDDPVPPSATFVYQLRLDNTSKAATLAPDPANVANPITVTDTLPHGFEFVGTIDDPDHPGVDNRCSATPAGPLENSIVTCHPQTQVTPAGPNPGDGHYIVMLEVIATQTGTFTNFANVSKYGGDVTPGDNSASDLTHVACPSPGTKRIPVLCVFKSDSEDPVPQGKVFQYTIKVQNERTGPEDAYTEPVHVTDTLPPGMTVQSTAAQNGSCGPVNNGVLSCTINPPIPAGGSSSITVNVIALQVGTFENVACIDVFERLTCANQPTTIIGAADLMIEKTATPNPVEVGSPLTYSIKVTNKGPASVPNVQMDDSIPANVTFVSTSDPTDCALAGTTNFHCNLGTMDALTSKTVTIVVTPTAPGTITNTATVANDGTPAAPVDFDLSNNKASFTVDAHDADVAITKVAAPSPVGIGQPVTYTITVTNKGDGVASGVVVKDPLPSAVSLPNVTTSKGTCSGTATITCTIGSMDVAEVVTITIQVSPTAPGTFTNTATVDATSFDPDTSNNTASASITITAADVTITKTASPDPVSIGTTLTYTLRVTNLGPNRATGVTVHDTLPSEVAIPTSTPSQGTCFGSPTVTCVLGDLDVNVSATVTIVVTPIAASSSITNTASVSSAFDLNSGNNTATATTSVLEPAIAVSPDIGVTGFVPFASGHDFPPNAPLELTWSPGLGKRTLTAGPDGTFRVSMLVLPNDTIGPRQLVATALAPQDPATDFLATTTDFLVVSPTSQPFQVKPQVPVTKLVQRSG